MIARLVFWLTLLIVAAAPLPLGSNRPWAWSLLAFCSSALLALWAIAALANPALHNLPWPRYRAVALCFLTFLLWGLFQATGFSPATWHHPAWQAAASALGVPLDGAISLSPTDSLTIVMRLASYASIFWLGMQLGRRPERARLIWWGLTLAVAAYAVYGLVVQIAGTHTILWLEKWSYYDSLTSTFVNRSHFAAYAGLGLILTLTLIADEVVRAAPRGLSTRSGIIAFLDNMRPPLFVLVISFVIVATALLLTHSRGGALSAAFGILAMLGAFGVSRGLRSWSLIVFGAIIFATGLAILLVSGDGILTRMIEIAQSAGAREKVYALTLAAIAERPLLGTGLGSFPYLFRMIRNEAFGPNDATYDVVHNSYLEMAAEAGIPAALLFYATLALIAARLARGVRERRRDVIFPCGGLAACVLFGIHSLVDFSLQIPAIAATFSLVLGVAYSQSWRRQERAAAPGKTQDRE